MYRPSDTKKNNATGFSTQMILKYLYNERYGTDVHPDDYNEIINDEDEEDTDKTTTSSDEASS